MSASFATPTELAAFLAADTPAVVEPERLLARATELLDNIVRRPFAIDGDGLPTDANFKTALSGACCAQVEFWLELGEDHDVTGLSGGVAIQGLRIDRLPGELAPRALRILHNAGLLSSSMAGTTSDQFFWSIPSEQVSP